MIEDDRATTTRDIIREIHERLQRGAPMTLSLLARIPRGVRVELSVTMRCDDGIQTKHGTIIIENGAVTYHPAGERSN
jgi:hypothetical protein